MLVLHRNRMVLAQEPLHIRKALEQVLRSRIRRHRKDPLGIHRCKARDRPVPILHQSRRRDRLTICDENSRRRQWCTSKKSAEGYAELGRIPIASVVRCTLVHNHNTEQKQVRRKPNKQKQKEQT
jgi:hypothetical protein